MWVRGENTFNKSCCIASFKFECEYYDGLPYDNDIPKYSDQRQYLQLILLKII